ncbi:helix-turn-helix domain-containing protein [Actinomadura graeca]|uniref:Helix-turn-helix domain-containing protein n=1 Tax=Actinomadura graeca TaxID=2750812 RepID=A0ABX8R300_9ACTN|nr:helix-turn-helix transcriptional regulator [Actinomadura graeca]QXJ23378.1 helix-turn-helix domain-containing protein [Actinomadura graeca]
MAGRYARWEQGGGRGRFGNAFRGVDVGIVGADTGWSGWSSARDTDALTRPRMVLGARLRALREGSGLRLAEAALAVGSPARLQAMERGITPSDPREVIALAEMYGISDHGTRMALLELSQLSRQEGWWAPYRQLIRSWFLPYLGAEQSARVIRCYAREIVPDLLQHPDYARAVIRARNPRADEREIDQRLRLRLRRQRILHGERPVHLWAILDEAVFRRPVVNAGSLYRQLEHLQELCELPHVTIQLHRGDVAGLGAPLTLVQLPERNLGQVVFLERFDAALYPEESDFHRHEMNALAVHAPPPDQTPARLRELISKLSPGMNGTC